MAFNVITFLNELILESSRPDVSPTFSFCLGDLPAEWHIRYDERAAILEYDGGLPREHAEALALQETFALMAELHKPEMQGLTDREQYLFLLFQTGRAVAVNLDTDRRLCQWARECGRLVDISQSDWACPFPMKENGANRRSVLRVYEEWFCTQENLIDRLPELRGKLLGCHCSPLACHGDLLARWATQL